MNAEKAKEIANKIIGQIFGYQNPFTLEQFMEKFAFDVRLPQQVFDSTTNEPTWAQSTNPTKFIKMSNAYALPEEYWYKPKKPLNNMQDILAAWNEINYISTERHIDSTNIAECDNIYFSDMVYRSQDISGCRNILFSDGLQNGCEYIAAGQRSNTSTFCLRIEDSKECSNSFAVSWSQKINNSFFIHDAANLSDCMFCSNMNSKQYCIANMQFTKEEYEKIKPMVLQWILTS
jgi:hypothetical protein